MHSEQKPPPSGGRPLVSKVQTRVMDGQNSRGVLRLARACKAAALPTSSARSAMRPTPRGAEVSAWASLARNGN